MKDDRYNQCYMKMAEAAAELSYANRAKVGCVIVSEKGQIISHGWNGMPTGFDNCCENAECQCQWIHGCQYTGEQKDVKNPDINFCIKAADGKPCNKLKLITKDEVLHAESNAIAKCAKNSDAGNTHGASVYVTLSPCLECAKLMIQAGIRNVYYRTLYRNVKGIDLLIKTGIKVQQI